jgi:hypothetical protein
MSRLQQTLKEHNLELDASHVTCAALLSQWISEPETFTLPEGFEILRVRSYSQESQVGAVYVGSIKACFVAWHGTTEMLDILQAGALAPAPLHASGLEVHSGIHALASCDLKKFHHGFKDRLAQLSEWHMDVDRIIFTGFSLGGGIALASMLEICVALAGKSPHNAQDFVDFHEKIHAVVFGSPMILSSKDCQNPCIKDMSQRCINFIYGNDMVPRLPGYPEYVESNHKSLGARISREVTAKAQGAPRVPRSSVCAQWASNIAIEGLYRLKPLCQSYRHIGRCVHLTASSMKVDPEDEEILTFDETLEETMPGTLVTHHSMREYLSFIRSFNQLVANGEDAQNCIARLGFEAEHTLWSYFNLGPPRYRRSFSLSLDDGNIATLKSCKGCFAGSARLISFSGNSTSGKSFLIQKLQLLTMSDHVNIFGNADALCHRLPYVHNAGELEDGATSGHVSLYFSHANWLLDFEGTKGTSIPSTMGSTYRDIFYALSGQGETDLAEVRSNAVQKYLPPFALLTSNVFCYVTTEAPQTRSAYEEVRNHAERAWNGVQNCSRPCLVVIQNKVPNRELRSHAESTRIFRNHDAASQTLSSFFCDIHFVQLPVCDPLMSFGERNMQDIFNDRLRKLSSLLNELVCKHHEQQAKNDAILSKGQWLNVLNGICAALNAESPVSMGSILSKLSVPASFTFKDVFELYAELLSVPYLHFQNLEDLRSLICDALDNAMSHAARIMVSFTIGSQHSAVKFKEAYHTQLQDLARKLNELTPCMCEFQPPADAPQNCEPCGPLICAQPLKCHDLHRAVYLPHLGFLETSMQRRQTWPGEHTLTADVQAMLRDFVEVTISRAEVLSKTLHASSPPGNSPDGTSLANSCDGIGIAPVRMEDLRACLRQHSRNVPASVEKLLETGSEDGAMCFCFDCSAEMKQTSFIWRFLTSPPKVSLCQACSDARHTSDSMPMSFAQGMAGLHTALSSCDLQSLGL